MGAWFASLVDMIVRMTCVPRRFNSGKWHNIQVYKEIFMLNLGLPVAIFDMDGTLIDSMPTWRTLNTSFLARHSLPATPELLEELDLHTMPGIARVLIETFSLSMTVEEIVAENYQYMDQQYDHLGEKPGAHAYLDALRAAGVRMAVATYTPLPMALHALQAQGMLDYFAWVTTPEVEGIRKTDPAFFRALAQKMAVAPEEIVVDEDTPAVLYAAKESGAKAAAIAESVWQDHWPEMQKKCDIAIKDYRDLLAQNPKT